MAEIQVRVNKFAELSGITKEPSHLVIVVAEDDDNRTFFRGGPASARGDYLGVSLEDPFGQLITDSGPFVDGGIDHEENAEILHRETIPQSQVETIKNQFQSQLDAIEAARYVYHPTPNGRGDGNSNSVVGTLMKNVRGVDLDISNGFPLLPFGLDFGDGATAPGENIYLVDQEGNRTFPTYRDRSSSKANFSVANEVEKQDVSQDIAASIEPQVINGIAGPKDGEYQPSSSAPQQSSSYGQLLVAQRFVEQHLNTKPQLPNNQEVDDLLAKISPLRAELQQRQQIQQTATIELEQLEQRGERSILNPLGYSDRQHDQVFDVWRRASDAVHGQDRENYYYENRVQDYAQTIRSYQQWEQQPETSQMRQIQQLLAQPEMQSQLAFAQRNDALFHQSMEAATAFDQPPISPNALRAMHSAFLTEGSLPSEEQMATLEAMTDQYQAAQQAAATPDLAVLGA